MRCLPWGEHRSYPGLMSAEKAASPAKKASKKRAAATARTMSEEHKAALAVGREQGRAVRAYLDALDLHKPKRGRRRTSESVLAQLGAVESELASAVGAARLELLQRRRDLHDELERLEHDGVDLDTLKDGFVRHGREYAERKGISYQTFREFGVPAAVLKETGIPRTRG